MKHVMFIIFSMIVFLLFSCASEPSRIDSQSTIDGTIRKAIKLLEQQDYEAVFTEIAYPDDVAMLTNEMPFTELIQNFQGKPADYLLQILKIIQKKDPIISNNGLKAEWKISTNEMEDPPPMEVIFEKLEGKWYLRN